METTSFVRLLPFLWAAENSFVRFFLAVGEERAMLVDTGLGNLDLRAMIAEITDKPVLVINTHSDGDHISGNAQFPEIYIHPNELDRYANKASQKQRILSIQTGEIINLGGITFQVLLTPGHTPGSICLWEKRTGTLISGDTIQTAPVYMFGEGRNLLAYISSLEQLSTMENQIQHIFPSHGKSEISADSIEGLKTAAKKLAAGEIKPELAPDGMPCKLYRWNDYAFYA